MIHPELTPLDSSAVKAYHHDPDTRVLHVQFPAGTVYRFDDVPAEKVHAMITSPHPGVFFNKKIAGVFSGRKVR